MFYNADWGSCYDEMITWLPVFYREVREMIAILKAHGSMADDLQTAIENILYDAFIDTADETAISRLETFLGITGRENYTLEERRAYVKSYFLGFGKISETVIKEMILAYAGAEVSCRLEACDDEGNNCLYIDFEENADITAYYEGIADWLERRLPAHILRCLTLPRTSAGNVYSGAIAVIENSITVSG